MHDIAFIRANPAAFDAALARRGLEPQADRIVTLDAKKREAATRVQQAQSRRNDASKAIGQAMGQGDKDKAEAMFKKVARAYEVLGDADVDWRVADDDVEDDRSSDTISGSKPKYCGCVEGALETIIDTHSRAFSWTCASADDCTTSFRQRRNDASLVTATDAPSFE